MGLVPLAGCHWRSLPWAALGCLGGLAPCWLASFDLYHHHHNLAFFFLSNSSFSSSPTTHPHSPPLHLSASAFILPVLPLDPLYDVYVPKPSSLHLCKPVARHRRQRLQPSRKQSLTRSSTLDLTPPSLPRWLPRLLSPLPSRPRRRLPRPSSELNLPRPALPPPPPIRPATTPSSHPTSRSSKSEYRRSAAAVLQELDADGRKRNIRNVNKKIVSLAHLFSRPNA